ncbi:hypothetical protein JYT44_00875 [Caldithrix abyssi]|nr:hypothetical protein [Caldithrix abyssi]
MGAQIHRNINSNKFLVKLNFKDSIARLSSKILAITCTALPLTILAQDFDQVQIKTAKMTEGIKMLIVISGNIEISIGEDGVFLIDDQYTPVCIQKYGDKTK